MAKKKKKIYATEVPEWEPSQYEVDMMCKYGDYDDDDELGLTQEDIDQAVKYGENPFE